MSYLVVGIIFCLLSVITCVWTHHLQTHHLKRCELTDEKAPLKVKGQTFNGAVPAAISLVMILIPLMVYSHVGRFSEWDKGVVDENIDYLIAADINKNARKVNEQPNNEIALLNLAQAYADGGLYAESVVTLDDLIALSGENAKTLGMKATAMYYRDGREMSLETKLVLSRALALDKFEFQSQLLIATDAYLNQQYTKAIAHWKLLLQSDNQSFNRALINNAISKTEQIITSRSVTASE
ncbi:tetratricopeptide repeat protein [Shewanella intestini]|uniref:Nitrite reductase n=1 Tax=Shewanella intestini TaxID=2017544 RepID=A0ABS5I432_9GAMM|nr:MULTISPECIES: nitrite reductase [Shewanella]MBR9728791.1 nitrite reductase [Shewanella intestini]MRG36866.1 nitrite reductase [Shewanella sp. XMDDZSB0408]